MQVRALAIALGIVGLTPTATAEPMRGSNWRYQEKVDPISDLTGAAVEVVSTNGKAKLVVACDIRTKDRPISVQYAAADYVGSQRSLVTVRFDKGEILKNFWDSSGRTAFIYSSAVVRDLLREFVRANQVAIRAEDEDNQPVDAAFDLSEAKGQIERVMRSCGKSDLLPRR